MNGISVTANQEEALDVPRWKGNKYWKYRDVELVKQCATTVGDFTLVMEFLTFTARPRGINRLLMKTTRRFGYYFVAFRSGTARNRGDILYSNRSAWFMSDRASNLMLNVSHYCEEFIENVLDGEYGRHHTSEQELRERAMWMCDLMVANLDSEGYLIPTEGELSKWAKENQVRPPQHKS